MRYQVFDNGTPAQYPHHMVDESWENSIFDTFEEAHSYANNWLEQHGGVILTCNVARDYSGCGDLILIKEIE